MKDHFIQSFVYGLGNTTGVVTVLGIVSGIAYLVNNAFFNNSSQLSKTVQATKTIHTSTSTNTKSDTKSEMLNVDDTEREIRMQMYQQLAEAFNANELKKDSEDSEDERINRLLEQDLSFSFCEDEKRYKRLFDNMKG